jgi:hypothetical protein
MAPFRFAARFSISECGFPECDVRVQAQLQDVAAVVVRVAERTRVRLTQRPDGGVAGLHADDAGPAKRLCKQPAVTVEGEKLAELRRGP